jgi:hypothetical protein
VPRVIAALDYFKIESVDVLNFGNVSTILAESEIDGFEVINGRRRVAGGRLRWRRFDVLHLI